jgi:hypothetical protein
MAVEHFISAMKQMKDLWLHAHKYLFSQVLAIIL